MDKTWIKAPLTSEIYKIGAKSFIRFAETKAVRGEIVCPCLKCCNMKWLKIDLAHQHILSKGFLAGYTTWTFHGEQRLNINSQANQNGSFVHKESKELMEKVVELVKQKANECGIFGPLDTKLQNEIYGEVWKELVEARKLIGYGVGVKDSDVSKLSADLRRIRNDNLGSNELHTLQKIVSVHDARIKEMRSILHYLVSQFPSIQAVPSGMYSNVNIDPTLFVNNGQSQSQVCAKDDVWKKLYVKDKSAKILRKKGCKQYDKTGVISHSSTKSTSDSEDEYEIKEGDDYEEGPKAKKAKSVNDKKLGERVNTAMVDALVAMSENSKKKLELLEKKINATTYATSTTIGDGDMHESKEDQDLLMKCIESLVTLEGIDGASFTKATKLMHDDPMWRKIFLQLPNDRKKDIVLNI